MSQQDTEKVRVNLDEKNIPQEEIDLMLSDDPKIWKKSGNDGKFMNTFFDDMEETAPTVHSYVSVELNKPELKGKKINFNLKSHLFGISFQNGFTFMWRLKPNSSGGGFGGGKGNPPMPLAEVFSGTMEEVNKKIAESDKNWYLVGEGKPFQNPEDGRSFLVLLTIRRNKPLQQG